MKEVPTHLRHLEKPDAALCGNSNSLYNLHTYVEAFKDATCKTCRMVFNKRQNSKNKGARLSVGAKVGPSDYPIY